MCPESNLIYAGNYAILAVQINGYLPLTIVRGKLTIKYSATTFILQCLFNLLVFISFTFMFVHPDEFYSTFNSFAYTEKLIMDCLGGVATLVCVYFRFNGIWVRKSTLKFWDNTIKLLTIFENASIPGLDEKLSYVRSSVRKSFVTMALIISVSIVIMVSLTFTQKRSEYWEYWGSNNPWSLVALAVMTISLLLREFHGIWLIFFIKIYIILFSLIESKLRNLEKSSNDLPTVFSKVLPPTLEWDIIKECYRLYSKVEDQTREFSFHFRKQLILETLLAIFYIVVTIFVFMRSGHCSLDRPTDLMFTVLLLIPVAVNCKRLYELGSAGSQLTATTLRISDQLLNLYYANAGNHNFRPRQDLQMFAMRIHTSPPKLDAWQYFTFNRNLLTAVS